MACRKTPLPSYCVRTHHLFAFRPPLRIASRHPAVKHCLVWQPLHSPLALPASPPQQNTGGLWLHWRKRRGQHAKHSPRFARLRQATQQPDWHETRPSRSTYQPKPNQHLLLPLHFSSPPPVVSNESCACLQPQTPHWASPFIAFFLYRHAGGCLSVCLPCPVFCMRVISTS